MDRNIVQPLCFPIRGIQQVVLQGVALAVRFPTFHPQLRLVACTSCILRFTLEYVAPQCSYCIALACFGDSVLCQCLTGDVYQSMCS